MNILKTILTMMMSSFASTFSFMAKPSAVSNFQAWWFMGGGETNVIVSSNEQGIQNVVTGKDTDSSNAWKYGSKIPNCASASDASYITDSFSIQGNHEVSFRFSINAVNSDGSLNYQSANNKDIDIYVYNSANNEQLCALRIWFDAGGYTNGNHSYVLGSGTNYPGAYNGMNWINGDATLSSSFYINFTRENLFRSYVNKDSSKLVRLDNSSNGFYTATKSLVENVDNIYFMIKGDGGWSKSATIILKEINGQSLSVTDGSMDDNVGPDIIETGSIPASIEKGSTFTIPVTAVDVLSTPTIQYLYDGTALASNSVTFDTTGSHKIKVIATDGSNNTSEKEYTINVTGKIEVPTITGVPTIEDQRISFGTMFTCGLPTYEDNSGLATVTAQIASLTDSTFVKDLAFDSLNNCFQIEIDDTFVSGQYGITYKVTNSAGTATSTQVVFNLETYLLPVPDFVTYDDGITVKYVNDGLLVHSIGKWRKTSFGVFDIRNGIDAYFTIPIYSENGQKNTASYFDMKITNYENSNYWVMYRIWLNEEFLTNDSSPTNMYFNFGTPGNSQCADVNDCGWLTRTVDGVDGKFHFNYDTNDGFSGEFRNVLQAAAGSTTYTQRLFEEAGSNNFIVEFYVASRDNGAGDDQNSEFIMNELNDQSLANVDGEITSYARPKVSVGTIESIYQANTSSTVYVYAKDILNLHPTYYVRFTDLNKTVVKEESFTSGNVTLNIPNVGTYKMKIFIKNKMGKEVGSTYTIEARSSVTPVSIDINGTYNSTFEKGDKVTVLPATYSSNVDNSKTKITLSFNHQETEVHAGDELSLDKAGMYTLVYYACDNATPNVNETYKRQYLNVIDREDPIVNVTINSTFRAEEEVNIFAEISDDTDYDVAIIITDTNGYKTTYNSNEVSFIPEVKGEYQLMVRVEDAYNNITIYNQTIKIGRKAPNKTAISWGVIGGIFALMLGAFIALTIYSKVKEDKEKV